MTSQRPSFGQDLVELAQQEMAAGRLGRRDFVRLMGALGLGAIRRRSRSPISVAMR
jgi:hypothetical protein